MKKLSKFEVLLTSHLNDMYRFAFRLTRHKETAEDLVQDMFVSLDMKQINPDSLRNPRAWLGKILYCRFVEHWRREHRSPLGIAVTGTGTGSPDDNWHDHPQLDTTEDFQAGPETLAMEAADQALLLAALEQLSDEHRDIIVLHDVEGYTFPELQEILEVPVGTLKSRLHRARHKLQLHLEATNYFEHEQNRQYARAVK